MNINEHVIVVLIFHKQDKKDISASKDNTINTLLLYNPKKHPLM